MINIINTRNDVLKLRNVRNTTEYPKMTENVHKHPIIPLHAVRSQGTEMYSNGSKCPNFELGHKILTLDSRDDPMAQSRDIARRSEATSGKIREKLRSFCLLCFKTRTAADCC